MLAVIDTNIWISALISPNGYSARVISLFLADRFEVAFSRPLLQELVVVARRPRLVLRHALTAATTDRLLDSIRLTATFVDITGTLSICRDPKDNMVLETAVAAQAQAIVTRDDDLKGDPFVAAYAEQHGIQLLTVQRFVDLMA